ncbi:MAG: sortase [Candidatus Paceibacterota bacterium]
MKGEINAVGIRVFILYFAILLATFLIVLFEIGILPFKNVVANEEMAVDSEKLQQSNNSNTTVITDRSVVTEIPEYPQVLYIPRLERRIEVGNPTSTTIEVLERELQDGAVRYPLSAQLGEMGTVFLFGHSSSLPFVRNQNYKIFNGIENLKPRDVISVYSGSTEFVYSVVSVREATVESDYVQLRDDGYYLILSTCNNLKGEEDRFILTAELVAKKPLSSN